LIKGNDEMAAADKVLQLAELGTTVQACRRCPLGHGRIMAVPGGGNPNADIVFIGEAPGAKEDKLGEPFVGAAGNVLSKTLEMVGLSRTDVFISNIVKCRPPGNRDPRPEEIAACSPYLHEQIRILRPRLLCALGRHAAGVLLGGSIKIMEVHGTWGTYRDLPLLISLHPSACLHNPKNRPLFEADIAELARRYKESVAPVPERA
jgi:uracil-DNA glycosylase family 4